MSKDITAGSMEVLTQLLQSLKNLVSGGLFESVDIFLSFLQSRLSTQPLYHLFISLQAEALHEMQQLEKAEITYKKALQFNKSLSQNLFQHAFNSSNLDPTSNSADQTFAGCTNMEIGPVSSSVASVKKLKCVLLTLAVAQNNRKVASDTSSCEDHMSVSGSHCPGQSMLGYDFYYKLARTQIARRNLSTALQSLLTIPSEARTLKVQVQILRVSLQQNATSTTTASYVESLSDLRDFLTQWPLALELVILFLNKSAPVSAAVVKELTNLLHKALVDQKLLSPFTQWIIPWVKLRAMEFMIPHEKYSQHLQQVASEVQSSVESTPAALLASIALCQFNNGDFEIARSNFCEARRKDPHLLLGMTKYCYLLYLVRNVHMLDVVATRLMSISSETPDALVALGYFSLAQAQSSKIITDENMHAVNAQSQGKVSRVLYISQKALMLDSRCLDALILKAKTLSSHELAKFDEALLHYREAIRCRPWSFEAHSGVVECNLLKLTAAAHSPSSASNSTATGVNPPSSKDNPHTQALLSALNAVKICGKSARTLTLLARVLRRDPTPHSATQPARDKLRATLEKALEYDPKYVSAILLKADILLFDSKPPPAPSQKTAASSAAAQSSSSSSSALSTTPGPNSNLNSANAEAAISWLSSQLADLAPESSIVLHEKLALIFAALDRREQELAHKNAALSLAKLPHDGSDISSGTFASVIPKCGLTYEDSTVDDIANYQTIVATSASAAYGELAMEVGGLVGAGAGAAGEEQGQQGGRGGRQCNLFGAASSSSSTSIASMSFYQLQ